jgi:hypothetical protein
LGAGLLAAPASAQDFRAFDEVQSQRASREDAVRMRFTLPFGETETGREEPRLAFGFAHDFGGGQMSNLDLVSFSLAGDAPRLETPLRLNANGDGSAWYESPTNWLLIGAGVAVAWAIYDHNDDDDEEAPSGPL